MTKGIVRLGWIVVAGIVPFFFLSFPSNELMQRLFDFCHLLYFALVGALLLNTLPGFPQAPFARQLVVGAILAILVGGAIESLQYATQSRSASMADLRRDVIGVLLGLALFSPSTRRWPMPARYSLVSLLALAVVLEIAPAIEQWSILQHARRQFPLLADFETDGELRQWNNGQLTTAIASHGLSSLAVPIPATAKYTMTTMAVLTEDWREYAALQLNVYREGESPLAVWVRVLDEQNIRNNYEYVDRYQREFDLQKGWNRLEIPMVEILNGPSSRQLQLTRVRELSIYTVDARHQQNIYIDEVRLVP